MANLLLNCKTVQQRNPAISSIRNLVQGGALLEFLTFITFSLQFSMYCQHTCWQIVVWVLRKLVRTYLIMCSCSLFPTSFATKA